MAASSRRGTALTGDRFRSAYLGSGDTASCPCGYFGDPVRECRCAAAVVARYQKRISGPLLGKIDVHLEVPRLD